MNRRKALIALGLVAAGLAGRFVKADEPFITMDEAAPMPNDIFYQPTSVYFDVGVLKELILEKDGEKITISMDEIFEAIRPDQQPKTKE